MIWIEGIRLNSRKWYRIHFAFAMQVTVIEQKLLAHSLRCFITYALVNQSDHECDR